MIMLVYLKFTNVFTLLKSLLWDQWQTECLLSIGSQVLISWAAVVNYKVLGWKLVSTNRGYRSESESQSYLSFALWVCPPKRRSQRCRVSSTQAGERVRLRGCWMVGEYHWWESGQKKGPAEHALKQLHIYLPDSIKQLDLVFSSSVCGKFSRE